MVTFRHPNFRDLKCINNHDKWMLDTLGVSWAHGSQTAHSGSVVETTSARVEEELDGGSDR